MSYIATTGTIIAIIYATGVISTAVYILSRDNVKGEYVGFAFACLMWPALWLAAIALNSIEDWD